MDVLAEAVELFNRLPDAEKATYLSRLSALVDRQAPGPAAQ